MIKRVELKNGIKLDIKVEKITAITSPGFEREIETEIEEPVQDKDGKPTGEFKKVKRKSRVCEGELGVFNVYMGVFAFPVKSEVDPGNQDICGYKALLAAWSK